tara:strand:- start:1230 stop:1571 length:342 start_codon:yes stop_codon:yes gene_type:complete
MNLPPSQNINLDAASLNETGPSSYQEKQAVNQTLNTQRVRGDIASTQDVAALQQAAINNANTARAEQHLADTQAHYYVAELKKASGINAANSASNDLAHFASKYPEALRALLR